MQSELEWVRIERTFEAPIETIWAMWTDSELFKQWYGPNGMSVPTAEMDVVVGGKRKNQYVWRDKVQRAGGEIYVDGRQPQPKLGCAALLQRIVLWRLRARNGAIYR